MPCNLLNSQLGGKESVKEFASINCQFVGFPFVTGGVGVGVAERLFKAKYPATPAKTTTRIINAMFANPFWFISLIIAKLIIDFDFRIKKFSSPKIKIWFESMFFYGFFCGFERCGSAAFRIFAGGIFRKNA